MLELRTEPAPADLRGALARALGDPSLELAYWLPDFQVYADLDGRPVELRDLDGRATTLVDRDGAHVAALIHDPALKTSRSGSTRSRQPPGSLSRTAACTRSCERVSTS